MSMERLGRQMQVEPATEENPYAVPNFIQQSNSLVSTSSKGSLSKASAGDLNNIVEEDKKPANASTPDNTDAPSLTLDDKGDDSTDKDNNTSNNNCDEGLGESFDQQSETSDSSLSINKSASSFNGMDTVPEEATPDTDNDGGPDVVDQAVNEDQDELTLDPRKLEASSSKESLGSSSETCDIGDTPFNKKMGSIKKVSFMWAGDDQVEENKKPVSDTYVYEGRNKKKFTKNNKK